MVIGGRSVIDAATSPTAMRCAATLLVASMFSLVAIGRDDPSDRASVSSSDKSMNRPRSPARANADQRRVLLAQADKAEKADDPQQAAFDEAVSKLRQALSMREPAAREKRFDEAQAQLESVVKQSSVPRLVSAAKLQLANLAIDRARTRSPLTADEPNDRRSEPDVATRALLAQAKDQLTSHQQELTAKLKQLPPQTESREARAERQWVVADLAQARLSFATSEFELGRTYPRDSREAKEHFTTAAQKFRELYDAYRRIGAGLYARIWEGRCHQELGDVRKALSCYQDLLELPTDVKKDQKLIRAVQSAALRRSLECWLGPEEKFAEAADRGEQWLRANPAGAESDGDLLAVYYLTAVACQKAAAELPEKDAARRKLSQNARAFAAVAAKHSGEFQSASKKLLERLGAKPGKAAKEESPFVQVYEQGKEAFEKAQAAAVGLRIMRENGGDSDTSAVESLTKERDQFAGEAMQALRRALEISDEQTPRETVNELRYWLCLLYWEAKQYEDCALMGQLLAEQDRESNQGRQGARLAMWARVNLYNAASPADKPNMAEVVAARAEYLLEHWGNEEEGSEAASVLLTFAMQQDASKAEALLERIPADAPGRAQAELKLGMGYARNYQLAAARPAANRPQPEELTVLREKARGMLQKGVDRDAKSATVSPLGVDARLTLAQLAIDDGQFPTAIDLLEDGKTGLLALASAKHPSVQREGIAAEIHRVALRAYLSVRPLLVDKVDREIQALEQSLAEGGHPESESRLMQIYVALARELQQQLRLHQQNGDSRDAATLSQGFEKLIARIAQHATSGGSESQNWIAETLYAMAAGLDGAGFGPVNEQAKNYYAKAASAFERMLEEQKKNPKYFSSADAELGAKLRLAVCYRRLGRFHDAVLKLIDVLKARPSNLTAQVQAAAAYQDRGATDSDYFVRAIKGGEADQKQQNLFWGWAKIAKMSMSDEKFRETFFDARYRLAECRFEFGIRQNNDVIRQKVLNEAKTDIKQTVLFKADLGGPESADRFDLLLKRIQAELHEKQEGLDAF